MNRPWVIWVIFSLCLAMLLVATGWISVVVVRLDRKDRQAQHLAAHEQDVRLALWRMDWALGALIARENGRPHFHYTAFYPAQRAYTQLFNALQYGDVLVPSPLLTFDSDYVTLHFQIDSEGQMSSPQTPQGNMLDLAQARYDAMDRIEKAVAQLEQLKRQMTVHDLIAAAQTLTTERVTEITRTGAAGRRGGGAADSETAGKGHAKLTTSSELRQRQQAATQVRGMSKVGSRLEPARSQASQVYSAIPSAQDSARSDQQVQMPAQDVQAALRIEEGDMQATWVKGELVLLRRVVVNGRSYVQGCWLDWSRIEPWLVGEVSDLLPQVRLVAVGDSLGYDDSARMLAAAPIKVLAGAPAAAGGTMTAPVRNVLLIVWAGVLLAAAAVLVLLKTVVALSERRGAFVSAVTHELRTPLTTFRMYSQMLADGMIRDEQKRQRYLDTLRVEADRLGHLVENVLAYARLERSVSAVSVESVSVGQLLDRIGDRLRQRAERADMALTIEASAETRAICVPMDICAVEQVLFNLVDNACKYARPMADERDDSVIVLEASHDGRRVSISVRDHGPGVSTDVQGRLFRPFSKSASEAANSMPGVGLGLALSRRLARRLGGELRLDTSHGSGSRFVLTLRRS